MGCREIGGEEREEIGRKGREGIGEEERGEGRGERRGGDERGRGWRMEVRREGGKGRVVQEEVEVRFERDLFIGILRT